MNMMLMSTNTNITTRQFVSGWFIQKSKLHNHTSNKHEIDNKGVNNIVGLDHTMVHFSCKKVITHPNNYSRKFRNDNVEVVISDAKFNTHLEK